MTHNLTIDTYNAIADEYARLYFDITKEDLPYVESFLAGSPEGADVLDAGRGVGGWVKYLCEHGFKAVGIDISRGMLETAREKFQVAILEKWIYWIFVLVRGHSMPL